MTSTFRDWKAILVFVGPALLLFTLVMLIPIVWSIGFTFFEGSPIGGFEFVGLDNYLRLIGDGDFHYSLLFMLKFQLDGLIIFIFICTQEISRHHTAFFQQINFRFYFQIQPMKIGVCP